MVAVDSDDRGEEEEGEKADSRRGEDDGEKEGEVEEEAGEASQLGCALPLAVAVVVAVAVGLSTRSPPSLSAAASVCRSYTTPHEAEAGGDDMEAEGEGNAQEGLCKGRL